MPIYHNTTLLGTKSTMKTQHMILLLLLTSSVGVTGKVFLDGDLTRNTLLFKQGAMTTELRNGIEPQLQCKEGCEFLHIKKVECFIQGRNEQHAIDWACIHYIHDHQPSPHFQVFNNNVICEGDMQDATVLDVGLCKYEYSIRVLSEKPPPIHIVVKLFLLSMIVTTVFTAINWKSSPATRAWYILYSIQCFIEGIVSECCRPSKYSTSYRYRRRPFRSSYHSRSSRTRSTFTTSKCSR